MDVREGTELTALTTALTSITSTESTDLTRASTHGAEGKRRYEKPEVVTLGDVRDLTLGNATGTTADGFGAKKIPGK